MKPFHRYFLTSLLALGTSVALAQDDQKPAGAPPAPPAPPGAPAPDAANRPQDPNSPNPPPPPGRNDGRHHEHHDGQRPGEDGRRSDMPPGSEGDRYRRGPGMWPMPPQIPTKPTPYIGVITTPPPAVLSAQLGLEDGFGLVVNDVLPDSPASKAGLQRYDVLTKFNDQQLVDSGQFSILVRALKKDTEASVTFIRKAQEQKVTVKIDERALPERRFFPMPGGFPGGDIRHAPDDFENASRQTQDSGPKMQERWHSYGDRMREYQERMKAWQKNPSADVPKPPEPPAPDNASIRPEDILREVRPGGVARIRLLRPDSNVTYNMADAKLFLKDDTGEVELTTHDGKRSLVAKNAKGETIFDGPIDTEEQRKALPEDVRKKIETIEVQRKLAESPQTPIDATRLPDVQ